MAAALAQAREPIVGLPCEGCEAVFDGLPATLASRARIVPTAEPGEPMLVSGRVLGPEGAPRAGIVVYAYQINDRGIYPPPSRGRVSHRHGALRAWVSSYGEGRYAFDTIRPASYPSRDTPQHIHLHVLERGCSTYYIDDILFKDDPLLSDAHARSRLGRGGPGIGTPKRHKGVWHITRDIRLGHNIPGYRPCVRRIAD
ncbi:dioxygenase family protein [Lysobacter koreensis]